jgi:TRAP-type C4-dicarboxylate transport system substrate-binding protein
MMVTTKATITATAAVAFIFAMNASMLFVAAHAESSIRIAQSTGDGSNSIIVTQSTEEGLEVECEGNLKCEIIGDGTVVTSSEDDNTSTLTSTAILNQSDMIQSENDLDAIDEQDLSSRITRMVDRILDSIFA